MPSVPALRGERPGAAKGAGGTFRGARPARARGKLRAFLEPAFRAAGTHRIVDVVFDAPACSARFDPLGRAKEACAACDAGAATRELGELVRCTIPKDPGSSLFFADYARPAAHYADAGRALLMLQGAHQRLRTRLAELRRTLSRET